MSGLASGTGCGNQHRRPENDDDVAEDAGAPERERNVRPRLDEQEQEDSDEENDPPFCETAIDFHKQSDGNIIPTINFAIPTAVLWPGAALSWARGSKGRRRRRALAAAAARGSRGGCVSRPCWCRAQVVWRARVVCRVRPVWRARVVWRALPVWRARRAAATARGLLLCKGRGRRRAPRCLR